MNTVIIQLVSCFLATLLFSVLFNQPLKAVFFSGFIATGGYAIFLWLQQTTVAYFFAALFIGIACEILARCLKMASTLFITCAIIPLVPGLGLFRTMFYLSQRELTLAGEIGCASLEGICAIALAITLSTVLFTKQHSPRKTAS